MVIKSLDSQDYRKELLYLLAKALSRNVKCFIELDEEVKRRLQDHDSFMVEFKKFLHEHGKSLRSQAADQKD